MNAQDRINALTTVIQQRVDGFNESIPEVEKRLYKRLLELLKDLKVVNNRVANGVENMSKINKILPELEKVIMDAGYQGKVSDFVQAFDEVAKIQNNYFASLNVQFSPPRVLKQLHKANVDWTVDKLTTNGINAGFAPAMQDILTRAMTTGAEYSELTEQVREFVMSGKGGDGALLRYSRQVTTDSINFFSANYHQTITSDLGLKWRMYTGSLLETSREWCKLMVEKRYVHEAELTDCITKEIDGVEVGSEDLPIYKKTGLPRGLMAGTDQDTVKVNRGGWQCGHQWVAVTESMVPLNIRIATYDKYGIGHDKGIANGKTVKPKVVKAPVAKPAPAPKKPAAPAPAPAPASKAITEKLTIPKFTAVEKKAIEQYTLSDYSVINPRLMGVVDLPLEKYKEGVDALDSAFLKGKTKEEITVSRYIYSGEGSLGIGGFDAKALKGKVGETITHKGFLSTTIDATTIPAGQKQIVNIKIPKGSPALYLDPFSLNKGEEELLLNRDSKFKIISFKEVNGKTIIEAELIKETAAEKKAAPAEKNLDIQALLKQRNRDVETIKKLQKEIKVDKGTSSFEKDPVASYTTIVNRYLKLSEKEIRDIKETPGLVNDYVTTKISNAKIKPETPLTDIIYQLHGQAIVAEARGYGEKGLVVDKDEFKKLKSTGEYLEVRRGVGFRERYVGEKQVIEAKKAIEEFKYGDNFYGQGIYGHGIYGDYDEKRDFEVARVYAGGDSQFTVQMLLRKDAKIAKSAQLNQLASELLNYHDAVRLKKFKTKEEWKTFYRSKVNLDNQDKFDTMVDFIEKHTKMNDQTFDPTFTFFDEGAIATILGYDAIDVDSHKYMVILNRSALIIKDTPPE